MNRIPIYLCVISALLLLGAGETTPGQEVTTDDVSNPFVGTWVLNPDKSSNVPERVKGSTVKIEAQDNGLKFKVEWIADTERNIFHNEWSPKYDGKFYPFIGHADQVALLRRINTNSLELVIKQYKQETGPAGGVVVAISDDGKTYTNTIKAKTPEGKEFTITLVYDKQEG